MVISTCRGCNFQHYEGNGRLLSTGIAIHPYLSSQQIGVEYIRTILYYLSDATERVEREYLGQVLLGQGGEGERVMVTIAQEYIQEGIQPGIKQ